MNRRLSTVAAPDTCMQSKQLPTPSFFRGALPTLGLCSLLAACGGSGLETQGRGEALAEVPQALLETNGNFEIHPNYAVPFYELRPGSTELYGWTIHDGGVDLVSSAFWGAYWNNYSIDLNAQSAGRISQVIQATAGKVYEVRFFLAGNPYDGARVKQLRVEAAGQFQDYTFDITGRYGSNMGWVERTFRFSACTSNPTLSFRSLISDKGGPALDLITVDEVATSPQPLALTNGNFESGPSSTVPYYQLAAGSTEIPGWTLHDGGIDYIRSDFWLPAEGQRSIDLSAQSAGRISQSFATTPCRAYQVDFSLAGNPYDGASVKQLRVEAAGQSQDYTFDVTGRYGSNMGWERRSFRFVANSSTTTLSFRSLASDNGGPALDGISVTAL